MTLKYYYFFKADPTCWELVTKSVSCHTTTVSHNNIDKSVGVLALEAIYPASKKLKDNSIVEKLFGLLIDQVRNQFFLIIIWFILLV